MNIDIPHDLDPFVQHLISIGDYRNETEVLIEGLRLLKSRAELREAVNAGIDQLESGQAIDGDEALSRLEARARSLLRGDTR